MEKRKANSTFMTHKMLSTSDIGKYVFFVCLNDILINIFFQLDGGTPEKICLVSRDENSVLVVTYAELKQNFERAFSDLLTASESQSNAFT